MGEPVAQTKTEAMPCVEPDVFDYLKQTDRLLTTQDLARLLSIHPKTIYAYVRAGGFPITRSRRTFASGAPKSLSGCVGVRLAAIKSSFLTQVCLCITNSVDRWARRLCLGVCFWLYLLRSIA